MQSVQNLPQTERLSRRRYPSIIGPIILIGLGSLFLAQNFGLVSGDVWLDVWRLWPLFFVLVGIDLIIGRRCWASSIAVLGVIALAVVAMALTTAIPFARLGDSGWVAAATMVTERMAEDLNGTRQATVDLRHSAGRLKVSALPASSTQLIQAELAHPESTTISRRIERNADRAEIGLSDSNQFNFPHGGDYRDDWTIGLSSRVPLDLRIVSGASNLDLDLQDLAVSRLDIQSGASAVKVVLPAAGQTSAHIKAGVAGIEMTVPEGVAARISADGALNGFTIDQTRFPKIGRYYQSPNYDSATNRVDLEVDSGVISLIVR